MKKFLILALLTVTAFGQTFLFNGYKSKNVAGSVVGTPVLDPQGWYIGVPVKGVNTNGTFSWGLSTNNEPTAPKFIVNLLRPTYNEDGTSGTPTNKLIYGVHSLRYAFPDHNFQRTELVSGTNTFYPVLSDYIYAGDTKISGVMLPGLYGTNGISTLKAFAWNIVNTSTNLYQPTLGNILTVPYTLETNSTQVVRFWACHPLSGWNGQPIRSAKVITTDDTHTITTWVTNMIADPYYVNAGGLTGSCYSATVDISTLNQGPYTNNIVCYPWEGDSNAILDSRLGPGMPTPLLTGRPHSRDNGTRTRYAALLDATLGNDTLGAVGLLGTFNQTLAVPYLTLAGAMDGLRVAMNAAVGTNNAGGCVIFANDGNYNCAGKALSGWAVPDTYCIVTRSINSTSRDNVNFNVATTTSGQLNMGMVQFLDVSTIGSNSTLFNNVDNLHWLSCIISNSGSPFAHNGNGIRGAAVGTWYVEKCAVLKLSSQGFLPLSQENFPCAISICNDLTNRADPVIPYVHMFNFKTNQSGSGVLIKPLATGSRAPQNDNFLFVGNAYYQMNANGGILTYGGDLTNRIGGIWALNLIENTVGASAGGISSMLGSVNTSDFGDCLNIHRLNNTYVGQRCNDYFEWETAQTFNPFRKFGATINCIIHFSATKQDDFTTPDARRTNNWSQMYGVMYRGSLLGNPNSQGFTNQFPGLKCYQYPLGAATFQSYMGFVSMGAADPYQTAGTAAGGGDYHLTAGSPAAHQALYQLFPFDISGAPLTGDSAGAFAYP